MRRSGLLTAVFALAVGIAVAFGASAAQLGADSVMEMAAYLGRKGVPVALVVPPF